MYDIMQQAVGNYLLLPDNGTMRTIYKNTFYPFYYVKLVETVRFGEISIMKKAAENYSYLQIYGECFIIISNFHQIGSFI